MNYRTTTLLARKAYTADGVETIDINLSDPVSQIVATYEGLNTSAAAGTAHPAKCITKIELVDGSDTLFSLSGMETQAADWYNSGIVPPNVMYYGNDWYHEMVYNINFGRKLWDKQLAWDPTKFGNPQLKITVDLNGGGTAPDAGYLTVLAHCFDEKRISPVGFLQHKEIKNYALGASAHEYTEIPTDHILRKLIVMGLVAGTGPEYVVDTIKLHEDNDKRIVLNNTMYEVLRAITSQKNPYREYIIGQDVGTVAQYFYCTPSYWPSATISQWQTDPTTAALSFYGGDGGRFQVDGTGDVSNWQVSLTGWAPHGGIEIPFGDQDDIADWYDLSRVKKLEADIKAGSGMSSSNYIQLVTQQLRRY